MVYTIMKRFFGWLKRAIPLKRVPIGSFHLVHAHYTYGSTYNFVDSCGLYMEGADLTEATCRACFAKGTCQEGTELLKSISVMKYEELPQFLVHERIKTREAAKVRLEGQSRSE